MLIDVADPRYGGAPDPDEERRRRWEPMDRKVLMPFLGCVSCLVASSVTEPAVTAGLTAAAVGFCFTAARAALPRNRRPADASDGIPD
jgi:hypothetical protein